MEKNDQDFVDEKCIKNDTEEFWFGDKERWKPTQNCLTMSLIDPVNYQW